MIKESYIKLGEFIEQCNERNINEYYGADELRGINNEGNVMPSKANIIGVSFHTYKIAHKGYFIYNPARLDIGSISCLQEEVAIFSQMYVIFKIKEKCKNTLLTEYLWMWFKRKEFFRYVAFVNFGSVREMFTYEDMCNVMLPVPPIEEQRRIVSEYQTVERRIANNEALIQKLEETAQAIYHHTFVEGIDEENLPEGWRKGCLEDIANFSNGKAIKPSVGSIPIYGGNGIIGFTEDNNAENVIVIGRVGANCGCVYYNEAKCWVNDNSIKGTSRDGHNGYLFFVLKSLELNKVSEGSGQPLLTQTILNGLSFFIPDSKTIIDFNKFAARILRYIDNLAEENSHLRTLLSLLTSKLS